MFLERKFSREQSDARSHDPALCPVLPAADWSLLPELLYDVICNIQLLLKSRRKYTHVFSDFGLTPSDGKHGREAELQLLQAELPLSLARYEPRFRLDVLDFEVDDRGVGTLRATGELQKLGGTVVFRFGVVSRKIVSLDYTPAPAG
jgi:hypothetical protein